MHGRPHALNLAHFQNGPAMSSILSPTIRICNCWCICEKHAVYNHQRIVSDRFPGAWPMLGSWHQYDDHVLNFADKRSSKEQHTANRGLDICETAASISNTLLGKTAIIPQCTCSIQHLWRGRLDNVVNDYVTRCMEGHTHSISHTFRTDQP